MDVEFAQMGSLIEIAKAHYKTEDGTRGDKITCLPENQCKHNYETYIHKYLMPYGAGLSVDLWLNLFPAMPTFGW